MVILYYSFALVLAHLLHIFTYLYIIIKAANRSQHEGGNMVENTKQPFNRASERKERFDVRIHFRSTRWARGSHLTSGLVINT